MNQPRSKTNTKNILGPAGVRRILEGLAASGCSMPAVCIGGVNAGNVQEVLTESWRHGADLNGVAVVSQVMAADDPEAAARRGCRS